MIRHNQDNFDLDNGADRDIEDIDISDRFAYTDAGLQADFAHTLGVWRWGFDMRAERREYERIPVVANYDQELYRIGTSIGYEINDVTSVSFGLRTSRTLYDERSSRDLDGDLLSDNEPLEYGYVGVELKATRRLFDSLELELTYLSLERTDVFLGYNDYTQDVVGLHAVYRPHRRFLLSLGATSRVYDYPNAFAFNDPAAGPKELEALATSLLAEFPSRARWPFRWRSQAPTSRRPTHAPSTVRPRPCSALPGAAEGDATLGGTSSVSGAGAARPESARRLETRPGLSRSTRLGCS